MYYFIKLFCVIISCIFVFGCSGDGRKYHQENTEYEAENYTVNCENLKFNLGEECILNSDIETDNKAWLSDFETRVENNKVGGTEKPNMQIRHKVYTNNEKVISVVTEKYVYINGVHGNMWWKARNFDVLNNCYLTLNDLFYDDEYKKVLNTILSKMSESDAENYHDLWEKPVVKNGIEDNFYIDGKKLVIFFQPYELSFYAKGVVEFPVEAEEIRGYIKEEYLNMMS